MPVPARSRSALAPKLMRRASGDVVVGDVDAASPSSMTLSSTLVDPVPALEMLPRRDAPGGKGDVWGGELPDRPRVEMDMRRRVWALAAAVAMGLGKAGGGPTVEEGLLVGERPNRPFHAWPGE